MNKDVLRILCAIIVLIALNFQLVSAQEESFKPGVSVGDSFTYKLYAIWEVPQQLSAPANIVEINNTEAVKMVVHEAVYAIVILNVTTTYKNGTIRKSQLYVNLLNGEGDGFGFVIAPNLSPNKLAYHMGFEKGRAFIIRNETVKRYPFGERKVLIATVETYGSDEYVAIRHEMVFDKITGVMLEWRTIQTPKYSPTAKITLCYQIIEFNVKTSESQSQGSLSLATFPALYLLIPAVIVTALIAVVLHRRKRKH